MAENYQITVEVVNKASATLTEISNQLKGLGTSSSSSLNSLNSQFKTLTDSANKFSGAVEGIISALAVKTALNYVDAIQTMDNKLRLVTNSQSELNATYAQLYDVAQRTYKPLDATVNLYTKLALSQKDIGLSTDDLMKVTEAFNKTLVLSGTASKESASALYQFAQAMQSGRLQGDELRTMLETNPMLMQVLQKQTGLTTAELRKLATDGFLSAKVVGLALADALVDLDNELGKMPKTVGQAITQLGNAFQSTVRDFLNASDGAGFLTDAIDVLTRNIVPLTVALGALATALAIAAIIKTVVFAMEAFAIAAGAATVATKGFTTALTLLAGTPLGRVISLVGVAAAGLVAWSKSSDGTKSSTEKLEDATKSVTTETDKFTQSQGRAKQALIENGGMAKVTETAFSKYLDQIKEQIKYGDLFSDNRRSMIEIDQALQKTVEEGRKTGKTYTESELENMRQRAVAAIEERDLKFKTTAELENRYKGYLEFTKSNQDKSLTDTQKYEKDFAQATADRIATTRFTEEEYLKYIDALRADYSKKYVDLIKSQRLANMTENQKYQAELGQLEDDARNNRLSKDLNFEEAKKAIQKKYADDYFKMSESNRLQDATSYEKYQAALNKFKENSAAQEVLTEEQKNIVLRKLNKDYVDATTSEYSNLYGYLNNKLVEMTGMSREKWGVMTDIVKLFGIDTNQLLKEAFTTAIGYLLGFTNQGKTAFTLFSSESTSTFQGMGKSVAGIFEWLGNGIVSVMNQSFTLVSDGIDWLAGFFSTPLNYISSAFSTVGSNMVSSFKGAFQTIYKWAGELADGMFDILGNVFDWAVSNIGDIASSIANWASGGGGGGGGFWDTVLNVGSAIIGWFSDARVKKNISYSATTASGINLYDFNYKSPFSQLLGNDRKRGVLAQEVKGQYPNAVNKTASGLMMVDYSKLPIPNDMLKLAKGGILGGPTMLAIAGEAGPEAVLPLSRNANGDLGVRAEMPMGDVNINFTINAIDGASVRDMLVTNSTTITNIVRKAVSDRGMNKVFGV